MENLEIYNRLREVPPEAQKKINGGRLNGMTDISPMWRIKKLTEEFGPAGRGWYTDNHKVTTMPGDGGEVVLSYSLDLHVFYKDTNEWSKPIHGIGGSKLVVKERNGLYTDDEAEKKAYTDAISVACKALGMGANVYWSADRTKYTAPQPVQPQQYEQKYTCERCTLPVKSVPGKGGKALSPAQIVAESKKRFNAIYCADCLKRMMEAQKQREAGN